MSRCYPCSYIDVCQSNSISLVSCQPKLTRHLLFCLFPSFKERVMLPFEASVWVRHSTQGFVVNLCSFWECKGRNYFWFDNLFRKFFCFRFGFQISSFRLKRLFHLQISLLWLIIDDLCLFWECKGSSFFRLSNFSAKKILEFLCFDFQVWLLPVEAGCKGTVAFFAGASYSRNKSWCLRLAAVDKTTCLPLEFLAFWFVP